ncbi:Hypothetical predicted protein, partial [Mytilus galloprovincialis]
PDWMKFFQTPTALERKRMEMVKREYNEGKMKPGSALVVNYISEGLPMLPGEAGLRLLKSVKVGRHKVRTTSISEGLPMLLGEAELRLFKSVKVGRHR